MKRRYKVKVLQPIPINGIAEPMPIHSGIILDYSYPVCNRRHQVIFKQGQFYGQEGDRCYSISTAELNDLKNAGIIKLEKINLSNPQ